MQRHLSIIGGKRLCGTVPIAGAKNAALPLMAAALLTDQPVELNNVPNLRDVATMRRVLAGLSVPSRRRGAQLRLQSADAGRYRADERFVRQMRASFCVLGPLVTRRGRAVVPLPGGCVLGDRPVDLHLRALEQLGAEITLSHGQIIARAKRLRGAVVSMLSPRGPSVTGTANVLIAATLARGTTVIQHAAREPEIAELVALLNNMGAKIDGAGSDTIIVRGVDQLHGACHHLMPDRIEAATYLIAAIVTGGEVWLQGARADHLSAVIEVCRQMGAAINEHAAGVYVKMEQRPRKFVAVATPYPGLPTDVLPMVTVIAALADGVSTLVDRIFPHRWSHMPELARMGAVIKQGEPGTLVTGVNAVTGASVTGRDLRATAALVLAGLAAKGVTTVHGLRHLNRGYENFAEKLAALGAEIRLVETNPDRDTPAASARSCGK